jgi:hypothetical protein
MTLALLHFCLFHVVANWRDTGLAQRAPVRTLPARLHPIDVSATDTGLARVRAQLLEAAEKDDFDLMIPLLADELKVDFELGREAFIKQVRAYNVAERRRFWLDMRDALQLGMARRHGEQDVCAPYVFAGLQDLEEDRPVVAITGRQVAVRAQPALSAPILERLTYDVVAMRQDPNPFASDNDDSPYHWWAIVTPTGNAGWVYSQYAKSPVGFRVCVTNVRDEWKVSAIVRTGD